MSKQLGITRSKSTKEAQEKTMKQAQSQKYRQQSDIIDITLLPPSVVYILRLSGQFLVFFYKKILSI